MNDNQKNFLNELHELFEKYSITQVDCWEDVIIFYSHGDRLCIEEYNRGAFKEITSRYTQVYNAFCSKEGKQ